MNFGLDKQIERLVEVLAASALLQANNRDMEALQKLRDHAFPNVVAEKINKVTDYVSVRGICSVVHCMNTHNEVELVADVNGKVPICVTCLEGGK